MKKVLVTDGVHPFLLSGLEAMGMTYDYHPKISLDEVHERVAPYEGLVINSKIIVDEDLLKKASKLEFIARLGSGLDIIDLPATRRYGVEVINSPEGNRNAVAEHALGMILSLFNNLNQADQEVKQKIWRREAMRGRELMGQTVGLIGFGHTGSTFAQKLSGMGVKVLAYDKYKKNYTLPYGFVSPATQAEILQKADIISLHLPLTDETHHLANEAFFAQAKPGTILINTSRGKVVDTKALVASLETGHLGGACLDVFENEKTETFTTEEDALHQRLYDLPNVILSPHVAGWTVESKERLSTILLDKLEEFYKDRD